MTTESKPLVIEPCRFTAREARRVLRQYDLGHVARVAEMRAGSAEAPKLLVSTDHGVYLLKRRSPAKSDPFKVAFAHEIQIHLAGHHFPVPHLIGTAEQNNTMLQANDAVYEMFEYLPAQLYDGSVEATRSAGRTLGLMHKLLADYHPSFEPPRGSFHDNPALAKILNRVAQTVSDTDLMVEGVGSVIDQTIALYAFCRDSASDIGVGDWPLQIVHADFHPGNALFWNQDVVGIIDFDGARFQQSIMDLANATLGYSTFLDTSVPPQDWPAEVDLDRYRAFMKGYDSVIMLSTAELEALPHLMTEAVLNECAMLFGGAADAEQIRNYLPWLKMGFARGSWISRHSDELRRGY